jgi:hypothetical protein
MITLIGAETGIKTVAATHRRCRLQVKMQQTRWGLNFPVVRCCPKADKRGRGRSSKWAKIEIGAGECKVPSLFAPDARGSLQRLIGDFIREHFFCGLVESDASVAHSSDPFVGSC